MRRFRRELAPEYMRHPQMQKKASPAQIVSNVKETVFLY